MPNNKKYPSKRGRNKQAKSVFPLLLVLGGALVVIVALIFALQPPSGTPANFTPEVRGTGKLKADRDTIDLGDEKLGTTVQASFLLTNVGDQPLKLTEAPYIEVKEGCWPPTPTIGSMVLQPGESTRVSMEFLMHGDMGGKHDFRLHLPNNSTADPDPTLTVLSNWIQ